MKTKKPRIVLVLLSGIIVSILSFLHKYTLTRFAITMVIVVCVFFIFGTILQFMMNRILANGIVQQPQLHEEVEQLKVIDASEKPKRSL